MIRTWWIVGGVVFLTSCGGEQKSAETGAQVAAYPIDWCVVTDEKLGSMGDPVSLTYQGREIKFCCKHCIEEFQKQPAAYLAKLDSAVAGLLKPAPSAGSGG